MENEDKLTDAKMPTCATCGRPLDRQAANVGLGLGQIGSGVQQGAALGCWADAMITPSPVVMLRRLLELPSADRDRLLRACGF